MEHIGGNGAHHPVLIHTPGAAPRKRREWRAEDQIAAPMGSETCHRVCHQKYPLRSRARESSFAEAVIALLRLKIDRLKQIMPIRRDVHQMAHSKRAISSQKSWRERGGLFG